MNVEEDSLATLDARLEGEELSDDAIAGTFRVLQRVRGHRYSLDDVATAWEAARARPSAVRVLDLGCGLGSVLLMLAWKLPDARLVGVEAQDISLALARRNVAFWSVTAGALAAMAITLYVPAAARVFRFAPLSAEDLALALVVGACSVLWIEIPKRLARRGRRIDRSQRSLRSIR